MKNLIAAALFGAILIIQIQDVLGNKDPLFRRLVDTECRDLGEDCRLLPKCCGDWQCYWADGYNPLKKGVCVECVQADQKCQRDAQCCQGLVCQKDRAIHKDGLCAPRRRRGEPCHEDDQCQSASCDQKWWQLSEGECE